MKPKTQRVEIGKACGWVFKKGTPITYGGISMPSRWIRALASKPPQKHRSRNALPDYLGDVAEAVALCDVLAKEGWTCRLDNGLDTTWECLFFKGHEEAHPESHYGCGDTLARAICEAFLRAKNLWVDYP